MNRTLDTDELTKLLAPKPQAKPKTERHPLPPQVGPLRYYDKEERCVSAGYWAIDRETNTRYWKKGNACRSPTHYKLQGIPICSAHALDKMNHMLIELGVER